MKRHGLDQQTSDSLSFVHYKIVSKQNYRKNIINHNVNHAKPETKNYFYQALVNRKIINTVFSKLFKLNKKTVKTQMDEIRSSVKNKSKTIVSDDYKRSFSLGASKKVAEKQQSIIRLEQFTESIKNFHKSMSVNKKRMGLLCKYNDLAQNFEKKLPKDPLEQTRHTIELNQKLIEYCIQDVKEKDKNSETKQKFTQIMSFKPPIIDKSLKKQFLKMRKESKIREQLKNLKLEIR